MGENHFVMPRKTKEELEAESLERYNKWWNREIKWTKDGLNKITGHKTSKKFLNRAVELEIESYSVFFRWLKNVLTISAGLLGIGVTFKNQLINESISQCWFNVAIIAIAIALLAGSYVLFGEVKMYRLRAKRSEEEAENAYSNSVALSFTEIFLDWRYRVSEIICYLSLVTALISLVLYTVIPNFKFF